MSKLNRSSGSCRLLIFPSFIHLFTEVCPFNRSMANGLDLDLESIHHQGNYSIAFKRHCMSVTLCPHASRPFCTFWLLREFHGIYLTDFLRRQNNPIKTVYGLSQSRLGHCELRELAFAEWNNAIDWCFCQVIIWTYITFTSLDRYRYQWVCWLTVSMFAKEFWGSFINQSAGITLSQPFPNDKCTAAPRRIQSRVLCWI